MGKYLPHGTTFQIGSHLVGGLISVGVPDRTRGEAETTDTDSGGSRSYIAGLREGGSVELTFRHDPDDVGQTELETNYDADGSSAIQECVITLPAASISASGGRSYTFDAFVTTPPTGDLPLEADEVAEQSATLKVAGAVTPAP